MVTGRLQPGSRQASIVGPVYGVDESNCWNIVAIQTDSLREYPEGEGEICGSRY